MTYEQQLFHSHYAGQPRLAGTRMSPFYILLELRMMEVVATATRYTKLQSNCNQQQTNTSFLHAGCLAWRPTDCVRAL